MNYVPAKEKHIGYEDPSIQIDTHTHTQTSFYFNIRIGILLLYPINRDYALKASWGTWGGESPI